MATGERLTLTYSHPPSGPLKLDLYCYVPPVNPIDPTPALDRLPFILFLHGGHFLTGSRRDLPIWLVSLARSLGTPLLSADYRLAPHAGPSHALDDLHNIWAFLQNDLQWVIASSGQGAEVESGSDPLEDDFADLQRRGGIDPTKGIIVGLGAGGYLATMGAGSLSPAPIAQVLGYPTLDFGEAREACIPTKVPQVFSNLLNGDNVGKVDRAVSVVPDMPILLERAPYASNVREAAGMDVHESWAGKEESLQRKGIVEYLLRTDQWTKLLRAASPQVVTPQEMLTNPGRINLPFPPTIIYHGMKDERSSPSASQRFIESIRKAEPVAAAADSLLSIQSGKATAFSTDTTVSFKSVNRINETSRYVFLGIQDASHGFDILLPRLLSSGPYTKESPKVMGDRYKAGMVQVESFIKHWLAEGSAAIAAKSATDRQSDYENTSSPATRTTDKEEQAQSGGKGARVRIPRAPRL